MLALTEPTIDAITELLSSESRYAKFRPSHYPPAGQMSPLSIESVLAEVDRRREHAEGPRPGAGAGLERLRHHDRGLPADRAGDARRARARRRDHQRPARAKTGRDHVVRAR